MDTLVNVDLIEKPAESSEGIVLILDRPQERFDVAILPGFTHLGHADLHVCILKHHGVGHPCVLTSPLNVIDFRDMVGQRPLPIYVDPKPGTVQAANSCSSADAVL